MTKPKPWFMEPTLGQWASFTAAWLGWVMDAFDFTVFLLVMKQIGDEFKTSTTTTAGIIALTLLTRLLGGTVAGWASDKWGRRLPLMISVVWFATCDGLISIAPSFFWIVVLRTLFGFGMGAEWTSGATLAMENWPERSRGIASGVLQGSWAIGYLLAGLAAGWIVPHWGWRGLFLAAAAPAVLALPIRFFVPESPEWKTRAALNKLVRWSDVFATPGVTKKLTWAVCAMAAGFGGYYGLTGNYSVMLLKSFSLDMGAVSQNVALFNVGMLLGAVICGTVAAKESVIPAVAVPALAMVFAVPLYIGYSPGWLPIGAFLGGMFGGGYSGVTPLLLTGLFPADIRARCVGLVYHLGAIPAAFVPMGTAALADQHVMSLPMAIGLVVVVCQLLMATLILFAPKESAGPARTEAAIAH